MRKPWWKRKGPRAAVIVVVVLAGLLVLADRVAAAIAEDKVATLISEQAGTRGVTMTRDPDVDMGGFPFLTQVVGGEYDSIDIAFRDINAEGVDLPELNVHARDVTAEMQDVFNGSGPVVARSMTADARITYDAISTALSNTAAGLSVAEANGQLALSATLDVAGVQVPVNGTASVELGDNAVSVRVMSMQADGVQLPPGAEGVIQEFARGLSRDIPLPPLPYELRLTELQVEPDAVVLSASAENVPLV